MAAHPTTEGQVAFEAPNAGKPCHTWYKIVGILKPGITPLITLHGGPGAGHEYLTSLVDIYEKYGIPVVFYDQIGCGRSTHLPEKKGDTSFWTFDLYKQELANLVNHLALQSGFHLFGQSWGGMFGGEFACSQPPGLRKLIISSGPASIPLLVKGYEPLIAGLPPDVRQTINDCIARGDYESDEFEKASAVFYGRHVCRLDPPPEEVTYAFKHLKEDPTAYLTL